MPISPYDLVINLSYLLFLVGYSLKDVFWLRIVIILAASVDIVGRYWLAPTPQTSDIAWCVGDIVMNAYQFAMLYRERRGLMFSEDEKRLYAMAFSGIRALQFKRMLKVARWRQMPEQAVIVDQGVEVDSLFVIYEGLAKVEVDGKVVSYLRGGNFVGEMSFLTGNLTAARVTALMPTRALVWDKEKLRELMAKDEGLKNAMHSVFSGDLLSKLMKQSNETAGEG